MADSKEKKEVKAAKIYEDPKVVIDPIEDFKKVGAFTSLYMAKKLKKKGFKFKREDELKAAEVEVNNIEGLKAKEDRTIICKGVKLTIIKGYPVSNYFSSLFTEAQKKQYFVK